MINSWNWNYQFLRFYRNFFCKTQIYTCNLHYNMYLYPLFTDIIVLIVRCAYLFSYGFVLPIKIRHRLTQSLNYFPSDVCACMTFCSFTSILLCLLQFNIPPKRKETWHSERNPLDGRKLQQLFQKCTVSIHFKKHVVNKCLTEAVILQ